MVIDMWALIIDGAVRETTNVDPNGRFHSDLEWVKCGKHVNTGMLFDGSKFTEPSIEGTQDE